jgi:hypothetical protein
MGMSDHSITTLRGCYYHHPYNKSKRISRLGSVYQIVLEDAGFECTPYTDSVKALQEFKPYFYDLILPDIKMPVLNGYYIKA